MSEMTVAQQQGLASVNEDNRVSAINSSNIILPKILLMQAMSVLVQNEKAKQGDFIQSLDEVVVGSKEVEPVEFIALGMYETLQTYENDKYVKTEELTAQNRSLPWEEIVGGVKVNRTSTINYYAILVKDIEDMKPFPHVITFKVSSYKAGKKLNTKVLMLEDFGAVCYAKTFKLVAKQEENDKGKYYVMDILDGRKCTEQEVTIAARWASRLKTAPVQVHEVEEEAVVKERNTDIAF